MNKFEENIENCDLLINSTSLGMEGINANLTLNLDNAKKDLFVYDIVYTPLKTKLLSSAKKLNLKVAGLTNQGNFLIKLGILYRAEILSKKVNFLEKTNIYYRVKRLVDKKLMGELFKVMLITKKNIKFKLGF